MASSDSRFLQKHEKYFKISCCFMVTNLFYASRIVDGAFFLLSNLCMNTGLALSLSFVKETRASCTISSAFRASSIKAIRVLRQSFLFSSRCSNLYQKYEEHYKEEHHSYINTVTTFYAIQSEIKQLQIK